MLLQSNIVSQWLGASLESALQLVLCDTSYLGVIVHAAETSPIQLGAIHYLLINC